MMNWCKNEQKFHIFFDASFSETKDEAIVAMVIKNSQLDIVLIKNKRVPCRSSMEAEFRALHFAISEINLMQQKYLMPQQINLVFRGDCLNMIEDCNELKKKHKKYCRNIKPLKYVDKFIITSFVANLSKLQNNNTVNICWISRNLNKDADRYTKPSMLAYC